MSVHHPHYDFPPRHGTASAAARIAVVYSLIGLAWVGVSDFLLASAGELSDRGLWVAVAKGATFVLMTAALIFWLARRELRTTARGSAMLRAIAEGTDDAVFVKDRDGKYLLFNDAAARLVGKPAAEVLGRDDTFLFDPAGAEFVMARDRRVMATGQAEMEEETLTADGVTRTYLGTKAPYRDDSGEVVGVVGVSRDVTEARRSEAALRESEQRFRELADAAPVLIWLSDTTKNCIWFNRRWLEFVGRSLAQEVGAGWVEGVHPDDRERCVRAYERAFDAREPFVMEYRLRRHDGEYRWVLDTGAPRVAGGAFAGYIGSCVDITDRKRAEGELRASEERLRLALAVGGLGTWDVDLRSGRIVWSDDHYAMHGYAAGEVPPSYQAWLDRVHPDDRAAAEAALAASRDSRTAFAFDFRAVHPDGTVRWLSARGRYFYDEVGTPVRMLGVGRDVTHQRRAADVLRASEERLRLALEAAHLAVWEVRLPDGDKHPERINHWDEAYGRLFGLTPDRLPRAESEFFALVHPDDRGTVAAAFERCVDGQADYACEFRVVCPDGQLRWHASSGRLLRAAAGGQDRVIGVGRDVTAGKRAEEALRASEERFRAFMDHSPTSSWITDTDGLFHYVSANYPRMFAAGAGLIGRTVADVYAPEFAAQYVANMRAVTASGRPLEAVEQAPRPDGSVGEFLVYKFPLPGGNGLVGGVAVDITERTRADAALRASEERLRLALEAGRMGTFDWDMVTGHIVWSDTHYQLWGYPPGDRPPVAFHTFADRVHPDDRAEVNRALRAAMAERRPYSNECRLLLPDGTVRWVAGHGEFTYAADGTPVRMLGTAQDVTDRKRAEEALRASEEQYRRLVEVLPVSVHLIDGGRLTYSNPACQDLFGGTAAELRGKTPFELVHPDSHRVVADRIAALARSADHVPYVEVKVVRLDGTTRTVHALATPIRGDHPDAHLVCLTDVTERQRTDRLMQSLLASVADAILTVDSKGTVWLANPATERLFGYTAAEMIGRNVNELMPEPYRGEHDRYIADYLRTGNAKVIGLGRELSGRRKDGTEFPVELTVTELRLGDERHFTGVVRDISARKKLEEQFRQSQKMEAIGRLAGGVAHDFNNLLTVINGYADLLLMDLPATDPKRAPVTSVRDAGERAAALTSQLLAFSRRTIVAPKVFDLRDLVAQSEKLLRRLIGEDIALTVVSHATPCRVNADPAQIDQVVMNLAVNARDAMPTGGRLTLETTPIRVAEAADGTPLAGQYVELAVRDTGCGMTDEVMAKIFEPFFTTKGVGHGTGLGLATVYGIVSQAGGHVSVSSRMGHGTTFRVLLPAVELAPLEVSPAGVQAGGRGTETVLLVEDDDAVRSLCTIALESQGYTVLAAPSGPLALDMLRGDPGRARLLISDVVMPEMSGRALADAVTALAPGLKVLFVSGYTDDAVFRHGVLEAAYFLQKPFSPLALARKVREVLDAP